MSDTRNKDDYSAVATKIAATKGDMSGFSDHERSLVESLSSEVSPNGNKVRKALGL